MKHRPHNAKGKKKTTAKKTGRKNDVNSMKAQPSEAKDKPQATPSLAMLSKRAYDEQTDRVTLVRVGNEKRETCIGILLLGQRAIEHVGGVLVDFLKQHPNKEGWQQNQAKLDSVSSVVLLMRWMDQVDRVWASYHMALPCIITPATRYICDGDYLFLCVRGTALCELLVPVLHSCNCKCELRDEEALAENYRILKEKNIHVGSWVTADEAAFEGQFIYGNSKGLVKEVMPIAGLIKVTFQLLAENMPAIEGEDTCVDLEVPFKFMNVVEAPAEKPAAEVYQEPCYGPVDYDDTNPYATGEPEPVVTTTAVADSIVVSIRDCVSCGGEHDNLEANSDGEGGYEVKCPTTGAPIGITVTDEGGASAGLKGVLITTNESGVLDGNHRIIAAEATGSPITIMDDELGTLNVFKDGNNWCATDESFVNLQESLAGFGGTIMAAVDALRARIRQQDTDKACNVLHKEAERPLTYEEKVTLAKQLKITAIVHPELDPGHQGFMFLGWIGKNLVAFSASEPDDLKGTNIVYVPLEHRTHPLWPDARRNIASRWLNVPANIAELNILIKEAGPSFID